MAEDNNGVMAGETVWRQAYQAKSASLAPARINAEHRASQTRMVRASHLPNRWLQRQANNAPLVCYLTTQRARRRQHHQHMTCAALRCRRRNIRHSRRNGNMAGAAACTRAAIAHQAQAKSENDR
jgi:hypothetical protein